MLGEQVVNDWVRSVAGDACDGVGGMLLQFGSAVLQISDRDSDLDVIVVVSEDIVESDFASSFGGGASGPTSSPTEGVEPHTQCHPYHTSNIAITIITIIIIIVVIIIVVIIVVIVIIIIILITYLWELLIPIGSTKHVSPDFFHTHTVNVCSPQRHAAIAVHRMRCHARSQLPYE